MGLGNKKMKRAALSWTLVRETVDGINYFRPKRRCDMSTDHLAPSEPPMIWRTMTIDSILGENPSVFGMPLQMGVAGTLPAQMRCRGLWWQQTGPLVRVLPNVLEGGISLYAHQYKDFCKILEIKIDTKTGKKMVHYVRAMVRHFFPEKEASWQEELVLVLCEGKKTDPDEDFLLAAKHFDPEASKEFEDTVQKEKNAAAVASGDKRRGRVRGETRHTTPKHLRHLIPHQGRLSGCYLVETDYLYTGHYPVPTAPYSHTAVYGEASLKNRTKEEAMEIALGWMATMHAMYAYPSNEVFSDDEGKKNADDGDAAKSKPRGRGRGRGAVNRPTAALPEENTIAAPAGKKAKAKSKAAAAGKKAACPKAGGKRKLVAVDDEHSGDTSELMNATDHISSSEDSDDSSSD